MFYPRDLPPRRWLAYYAGHFPAVELNATFYRLPRRQTVAGWAAGTPPDFRFAVKGSRLITHYKRLGGVTDAVRTFFDAAAGLGAKLAVVLWQLPPRFRADPGRLEAFLVLAKRVAAAAVGPVRHAVEVRDRSWLVEPVYEVLRAQQAALVLADGPFVMAADPMPSRRWPGDDRQVIRVPRVVPWTYVRRHGPRGSVRDGYSDAMLRRDARAVAAWAQEGDVYVFYNNDVGGHAVRDAARLRRMLGA